MKRLLYIIPFLIPYITAKSPIDISVYSVNFDVSLGKNDTHFSPYYYHFLSWLDKENSPWIGIDYQPIRPLYEFLRRLYGKNKLNKITPQTTPKIPLKVHQIWLGSPFPEKYKKWQQTWQALPGWEYKLWTDEDVKTMKLDNQEYYDNSNNYGERSDILRMEILYRYGGVYVDTDFECLQPELFTMLNHCYDFYTGIHPIDCQFHLENALIASIPAHPILKGYITELKNNYAMEENIKIHPILIKTGPGFLTKLFFKYADKGYKDIAFPPTFFYPLGNIQFHNLQNDKAISHTIEAVINNTIIKPESLAIHYWEGAWVKPEATVS